MHLEIRPPLPAMEAKSVDSVPIGDEWQYEPKWDGFRCLAFREDSKIELQFDWGFVPSTQAPDGDPLDILSLHEASTYPGVVLPCRPLGVVEMDQEEKEGERERNDRVIVMPAWHDRVGEFEHPSDLPKSSNSS